MRKSLRSKNSVPAIVAGICSMGAVAGLAQEASNELDPVFHHVHRLGPKRTDADRPRPIIAKCVYYKDRQLFIKNSFKLKGTSVIISEDYSKQTLDLRRQLV